MLVYAFFSPEHGGFGFGGGDSMFGPGNQNQSTSPGGSAPQDTRPFKDILKKDLLPYRAVIEAGVAGVMPAHVVYPQVDPEPAGYSKHWLQEVLRGQFKFDGLVFSDDLSMEGAAVAGGPPERAKAALAAGCDMVLLCNNPAGLDALLASLETTALEKPERLDRMRKQGGRDLRKSVAYREAQEVLQQLA